jgi:hypothetical protein
VFGTSTRMCCVKALHFASDDLGTFPSSSVKASEKRRYRSTVIHWTSPTPFIPSNYKSAFTEAVDLVSGRWAVGRISRTSAPHVNAESGLVPTAQANYTNSVAFSPRANYTDCATVAGLRIFVTWSARQVPPTHTFGILHRSRYFFFQVALPFIQDNHRAYLDLWS